MPAPKKGLSKLERHEVKISRAVLRGGSGGNVTLLPGKNKAFFLIDPLIPIFSRREKEQNA
jgi:hypothetical protein